jgi:uncharacterized protein YbcI
MVAEISREVVRVHARFHGRGPTKAKTIYNGDTVVVVMEDALTKSEKILVAAGHFDLVRRQRDAFRDQIDGLFIRSVEEITGRKVRSFLGQIGDDGVLCLNFLLEPMPPRD